jgi:hypothetical protein
VLDAAQVDAHGGSSPARSRAGPHIRRVRVFFFFFSFFRLWLNLPPASRYYHSAAVTDEGRVYTWGWGEHGQVPLNMFMLLAVMMTTMMTSQLLISDLSPSWATAHWTPS